MTTPFVYLQTALRHTALRIRLQRPTSRLGTSRKRLFSNGVVQENDIVLLRRADGLFTSPVLTGRLSSDGRVSLTKDFIKHEWIIGSSLRQMVRTKRGKEYRIYEPTLAEYTNLTPRLVTPIYPSDCHATLALLDLHPTTPNSKSDLSEERLEIFEAGTGHGSLTLNLSRAIHCANTAPPPLPTLGNESVHKDSSTVEEYHNWRRNRRAVIHTLDSSQKHSQHAEYTIKNFRDGMYYHNIDFHVGALDQHISTRLEKSAGMPFLDHAILDLPGCDKYLEIVSSALKPSGSLLVFCPNITQINTCVLDSKIKRLPLHLENVIELGAGLAIGGREWDVRPVRPRAVLKAIAEAELRKTHSRNVKDPAVEQVEQKFREQALEIGTDGWELICRPKIGDRIPAGGFVAQWRKMAIIPGVSERHLDLKGVIEMRSLNLGKGVEDNELETDIEAKPEIENQSKVEEGPQAKAGLGEDVVDSPSNEEDKV